MHSDERFKKSGRQGLCTHLKRRELYSSYGQLLQRRCYISRELVERLALVDELEGHSGCVNCIQWNERGTILASGSDDFQVILWDPFRKRRLHSLRTGHTNNIFSVQFLPGSGDDVVLSGAGDSKIRMHQLGGGSGDRCVHTYACHLSRVKRLAVTPTEPHLFWSAGEDGLVMEFDARVPSTCERVCDHVLVNLNAHLGADAEVKCIALSPSRPELLAVGANDPYVRLFDRRMLRRQRISFAAHSANADPWSRNLSPLFNLGLDDEDYDFPSSSVQYYCPGHLPIKCRDFRKRFRPLAATHVTFDPSGSKLLVNLGGEQIYLFDVAGQQRTSLLTEIRRELDRAALTLVKHTTNGCVTNGIAKPSRHFGALSASEAINRNRTEATGPKLPASADGLKQEANAQFAQRSYSSAIDLYSLALQDAPDAPVLLANRAAAFMKRGWDGDDYAALRDCYATIQLDPDNVKALFRIARCLNDLKQPAEAQWCLDLFKNKFPEHAKTPAFTTLDRDIKDVLFSESGTDAEGKKTSKRKRGQRRDERQEESAEAETCSPQDSRLRQLAKDYELRFCGHCNTTTDIKEANFFGPDGEFIVAGSDDGTFFVWDASTCNIVSVLRGDESIVNCLQPHPSHCLLATSGIESNIKLWAPVGRDGETNERRVDDVVKTAMLNQQRMNADPLEVILHNMGYRFNASEASGSSPDPNVTTIQCRQS